MPSTAAACTALPLLLAVLDERLVNGSHLSRLRHDKDSRLDILVKVMDVYRCQYEGVDSISEAIELAMKVVTLPCVGSWSELMIKSPDLYLQLAIYLDLTLNKGRRIEFWEHQYRASVLPISMIWRDGPMSMLLDNTQIGPYPENDHGGSEIASSSRRDASPIRTISAVHPFEDLPWASIFRDTEEEPAGSEAPLLFESVFNEDVQEGMADSDGLMAFIETDRLCL